jgi:hypothetical protein
MANTLDGLDQSTLMDTDSLDEDQSVKSNVGQGDQDSEMEAMEFRLFSSQDTPAAILLDIKEPEIVHVHYDRPELDESPGSLRMQHISEAAIDAATILEQAQVPWVTHCLISNECSSEHAFVYVLTTQRTPFCILCSNDLGPDILCTQGYKCSFQAKS